MGGRRCFITSGAFGDILLNRLCNKPLKSWGMMLHINVDSKKVLLLSCILYPVSCILYPVSCLRYTVYCILYTVYCILYTVYCILYTVYCILYTVYCIFSGPYLVCTMQCAQFSVQNEECTIQCFYNLVCTTSCAQFNGCYLVCTIQFS